MPWCGRSYSTCPGREAVNSTFPERGIVSRHVLVRTQFYDISGSGRSYSTCPGWDAVLRHTVVNYLIISNIKPTPSKYYLDGVA